MRLLAIDTCGPVIGVALAADGQVRCRVERVSRGAESRLMPWAHELCAEAGIRLQDVEAVAAATGPGAFTGIRVGLAAAQGVALALGVPMVGVSSLESRLASIPGIGPAIALLDAKKARVYALGRGADGKTYGPADVDPDEALGWMQGPFTAIGEGALVYSDRVVAHGGSIAAAAAQPGVEDLAHMGIAAIKEGKGEPPDRVLPVYLRPPDAKRPTLPPPLLDRDTQAATAED